ncbi:MAG TPA: helix-turn-helix domain-containing protein [Mycobacteriales bacterium]|nr:helix-turn-helix domain-containing protein [Mycobacteriales bacterium]
MSPTQQVVPLNAGTTRATILDAARRLFTEQGFDGTSLRQIADAVGTTKAAVYYHFPAKEHLLLELTRPWLDAMSALVTEIRSSERDTCDAEATLAAYLDLFIGHLPVLHMLAGDPATQNHPDIGRRARALVDSIQQHIAGPDPSDTQLVRAACALGVIHAVATLSIDLVSSNRDAILESAVASLSAPSRRRSSGTRQPRRRNVATQ